MFEDAYATAPNRLTELNALLAMARGRAALRRSARLEGSGVAVVSPVVHREFLLRKAALLDRIALFEASTFAPGAVGESAAVAAESAFHLTLFDRRHPALVAGPLPPAPLPTPTLRRYYVRQEYAAWHKPNH